MKLSINSLLKSSNLFLTFKTMCLARLELLCNKDVSIDHQFPAFVTAHLSVYLFVNILKEVNVFSHVCLSAILLIRDGVSCDC